MLIACCGREGEGGDLTGVSVDFGKQQPSPSPACTMSDCSAWLGFGSVAGGRRFGKPTRIETTHDESDVIACLRRVEEAVAEGLFAVGVVSYEAAPAFDPALPSARGTSRFPLLWFGLYDATECTDAAWEASAGGATDPATSSVATDGASQQLQHPLVWRPSLSRERYDEAIADVRRCIEEGWTYQVNFALRLHAELPPPRPVPAPPGPSASLREYFGAMLAAQGGGFGAFIDCGHGHRVYSASPELFFRWDAHTRRLEVRPMKGTARRGGSAEVDSERRAALLASEKDRAENLMIVDLLRSDAARVCDAGSVRCTELCAVEEYPTVFQLTSTVRGTTRAGVGLVDIFSALFPCGSVTGAPKVSTMRIIGRLEASAREAYCGALGYISPGGAAEFSVGIRTIVEHEACACDAQVGTAGGARAVYGVGGGVTWMSEASAEYDEVWAKAAVLERAGAICVAESPAILPAQLGRAPRLQPLLLETMRLCGGCGRFSLLRGHLCRLERSARSLGVRLDPIKVLERLRACASNATGGSIGIPAGDCADASALRVRVLVSACSGVTVEPATPLPPIRSSCGGRPDTLGVSAAALPVAVLSGRGAVSSHDASLRHKTTARAVYDRARAAAPASAADVLLVNERDEVTEFCIGNAFFLLDEGGTSADAAPQPRLVTPPLECGVLPGVARECVLAASATYHGGSSGARGCGGTGSDSHAESLEEWDIDAVSALDAGACHAGFNAYPPTHSTSACGVPSQFVVTQQVVTVADIRGGSVRRCWLVNSVRGWIELSLTGQVDGSLPTAT